MGLVLSLLVVAVGVIEALSCYHHFQIGLLRWDPRTSDSPRRRSLFTSFRRQKRKAAVHAPPVPEEPRPMTVEEKRSIKRVAKSQELHLLQLQQQHLQLQLHLKKVREREKLEQKKKETQFLVDSFFAKSPKATRSISLPERREPVKDDISKIIDELAQDTTDSPYEFDELYEETKRELRQQKRFVEKRPSVTDIALTLENVAPNVGAAIHNFAAEVLDADGLEHPASSGQFADASAHEEALFSRQLNESRQTESPTKPEYMVDLVMGDGGRMEVVLTETDRNFRHRRLSPPVDSDESLYPTSSSSENKSPAVSNIDDVPHDDADSVSSCSVETQITSHHCECDRDVSDSVNSDGCDKTVKNKLVKTEFIPIDASCLLQKDAISEEIEVEIKSELPSEISSSLLQDSKEDGKQSSNSDGVISAIGGCPEAVACMQESAEGEMEKEVTSRPQPGMAVETAESKGDVEKSVYVDGDVDDNQVISRFQKQMKDVEEVSLRPALEIATEPANPVLDSKRAEQLAVDESVVTMKQNAAAIDEETIDLLPRYSNRLELGSGDCSKHTESPTGEPTEILHNDCVAVELKPLVSDIPVSEPEVSLKSRVCGNENEVNENNHTMINSTLTDKAAPKITQKVEALLATGQGQFCDQLISSLPKNQQLPSDVNLQNAESGDKIISGLRQLPPRENVAALVGKDNTEAGDKIILQCISESSSNGVVEMRKEFPEEDQVASISVEILPDDSENADENSAVKTEAREDIEPLPLPVPHSNDTVTECLREAELTKQGSSSLSQVKTDVSTLTESGPLFKSTKTPEPENIILSTRTDDITVEPATVQPQNGHPTRSNEAAETPNETNATPYFPLQENSQKTSCAGDVRIENIPLAAQPKSATSEIPDQWSERPERDGESPEWDSEGKSAEDEVGMEADGQNVLRSPPHQIAGPTSAQPAVSTQRRDSAKEAFWLIFSGEYTKAMSKDWHSGHFSCWQCDEPLTGQRYVLRDDHPYCIKCYESVFANVCEECNKIIGIDSKDLSYKDKHWHEACFLCNKCRVSLVDKQFGSKADKIYCGNCYDAQFASRCDGCGEIFRAGTKKMEYKTRQWHEKCFCCCVCKTAIGTKSFIPREQEIYCSTCYEEKFATRCVKCNKIITSGGVTYKNEPWHRDCFTCTNCNTSLAGQRFTSREEKPYCADCFGELFAKRCTSCSRPITGIGGTRFISFEDRHWHNDCFICAACKTSLVGRGFITDEDDIICPECAKQRLM